MIYTNILENLKNYSSKMKISQIIIFFQRQNILFTKTMIQNYVRIGLLPPPVEKRYYNKKHIIFLTIINELKAIYSLEEIKNIFISINYMEIKEEDLAQLYLAYLNLTQVVSEDISTFLEAVHNKINKLSLGPAFTAENLNDKKAVKEFLFPFILSMVYNNVKK